MFKQRLSASFVFLLLALLMASCVVRKLHLLALLYPQQLQLLQLKHCQELLLSKH